MTDARENDSRAFCIFPNGISQPESVKAICNVFGIYMSNLNKV